MKHLHTFEGFLNEANNKAVTKQDWNRADDKQREKWLSSAIEDPNDIEDLVDAEWEDLPDVAISNMMKESLNEGTDYAVMLTGGSIGDKPRPSDARGYVGMEVDKAEMLMNLQNAKAKAKRMNGNLSPGEKSHYGLKYVVVPVSKGKFIKESLNEAVAYKNKNNIGDYVKFDDEKARVDNVYTAGNGKTMYTIGSSKHGSIDIEAEYVDENN